MNQPKAAISTQAHPYRLGPRRRIRSSVELQRCQKLGLRTHTSHVVITLYDRLDENPSRLGLVVSKRMGCSVIRSRFKRLLREAFRLTPELWPAGFDVVFIAKRPPEQLKTQGLIEQFNRAKGSLANRMRAAKVEARSRSERGLDTSQALTPSAPSSSRSSR